MFRIDITLSREEKQYLVSEARAYRLSLNEYCRCVLIGIIDQYTRHDGESNAQS
jgi:hypothetical protein